MGFGLRSSGFGLRASGFGLRASGFGLRSSDIELRASVFRLRSSGFGLRSLVSRIGTPCFVVLIEYRSGHSNADIEVSKASVDNDLLDIDGDGSEIRDDVDFGLAFDTLPTIQCADDHWHCRRSIGLIFRDQNLWKSIIFLTQPCRSTNQASTKQTGWVFVVLCHFCRHSDSML